MIRRGHIAARSLLVRLEFHCRESSLDLHEQPSSAQVLIAGAFEGAEVRLVEDAQVNSF